MIRSCCWLKQFAASNFKNDCTIDEDFEPILIKMNAIAKKYNINIPVTSSFRTDANVPEAIVTPGTHSNHMIGQDIDYNLELGGAIYNSSRMQTDRGVERQFINELKAAGIRWGGDLGKPDPVHFDDGLNIKDITAWTAKYKQFQVGAGTSTIA